MRLLANLVHPDLPEIKGNILSRQAVRGIVLQDDKILLLYTKRYDDFSFPGGGVDPGEDLVVALKRELHEEAGVIVAGDPVPFGKVSEHHPYWKPGWPVMHQESFWYHCDIETEQVATRMEDYEIANGMGPQWVQLEDAIRHNESVINAKPKTMGISIFRETHVLKLLAEALATA